MRVLRKPADADDKRLSHIHADGSCVRAARARYACHYKQRHPGECEGPSGYGIKTLDGLVDRVVKCQLQRIKDQPTEELLSSQQQEMINLMSARCRILSLQVGDKQQEIADYEAETIKVIRGQSKFRQNCLHRSLLRRKRNWTS